MSKVIKSLVPVGLLLAVVTFVALLLQRHQPSRNRKMEVPPQDLTRGVGFEFVRTEMGDGIRILGAEFSDKIRRLHEELQRASNKSVAYRTASELPETLYSGPWGGAHRSTDLSEEIYLNVGNFDECTVAHELLHGILKAKRYPVIETDPQIVNDFEFSLATTLTDRLQHVKIWDEIKRRGIRFDGELQACYEQAKRDILREDVFADKASQILQLVTDSLWTIDYAYCYGDLGQELLSLGKAKKPAAHELGTRVISLVTKKQLLSAEGCFHASNILLKFVDETFASLGIPSTFRKRLVRHPVHVPETSLNSPASTIFTAEPSFLDVGDERRLFVNLIDQHGQCVGKIHYEEGSRETALRTLRARLGLPLRQFLETTGLPYTVF